MANDRTGNVITVDSTGEILAEGKGCRILWIMHYAAADNGTIEILNKLAGKSHFKYINVDVSVLGNWQFFQLGGQPIDGLYLGTLTASNLVWIGVA